MEQRDICSDTVAAMAPVLGQRASLAREGETPQRGRAWGWGSRGLAWGPLATLLTTTLHHSVLRFEDISLEPGRAWGEKMLQSSQGLHCPGMAHNWWYQEDF